MSLTKVISGGQTGADLGGLRAARKAGIETGGWVPKKWMTEKGPMPTLHRMYGLKECCVSGYQVRTVANIEDADMTIIVAEFWSAGSDLTRKKCFELKKPVFHLHVRDFDHNWKYGLADTLRWVKARPHNVINIAGNRESKSPGIGALTETHLYELFMGLK